MYSERKGNDILQSSMSVRKVTVLTVSVRKVTVLTVSVRKVTVLTVSVRKVECQQDVSEANSLIVVEDIYISAALAAAGNPPEECPGGCAIAGNSAREEMTSFHHTVQYTYMYMYSAITSTLSHSLTLSPLYGFSLVIETTYSNILTPSLLHIYMVQFGNGNHIFK